MNKKVYLAYFDILGFKSYVQNHSLGELANKMEAFYIGSQSSMSERNRPCSDDCGRIEPDPTTFRVKALHISDSLIYWTEGDSIEDFENILDTSRKLIMKTCTTRLLLRGCITYGDLCFNPDIVRENKNEFYQFAMFGNSIVNAYTKAEKLKIVGCVIDDYAIGRVNEINGSNGINDFIKKGKVVYRCIPQKGENGVCVKPECIIKPFCADSSISELEFYNRCLDLEGTFKEMNGYNKKSTSAECNICKNFETKSDDMCTDIIKSKKKMPIEELSEDVKQKLNNTIEFYRSFLNPDKSCSK